MDWIGIHNTPLPDALFAGKVLLIVNVASYCGYTSQYHQLQSLYESRRARGLLVVAVPCNQFGAQEPGSATDIETFCSLEFGVTFPLLCKQNVIRPERSTLYSLLVDSSVGQEREVQWNFEKFLVARTGRVSARFQSDVVPDDRRLVAAIDSELDS